MQHGIESEQLPETHKNYKEAEPQLMSSALPREDCQMAIDKFLKRSQMSVDVVSATCSNPEQQITNRSQRKTPHCL